MTKVYFNLLIVLFFALVLGVCAVVFVLNPDVQATIIAGLGAIAGIYRFVIRPFLVPLLTRNDPPLDLTRFKCPPCDNPQVDKSEKKQ